jgi:hypothetical protein
MKLQQELEAMTIMIEITLPSDSRPPQYGDFLPPNPHVHIVFRDKLKDGSEGPEMVMIPPGVSREQNIVMKPLAISKPCEIEKTNSADYVEWLSEQTGKDYRQASYLELQYAADQRYWWFWEHLSQLDDLFTKNVLVARSIEEDRRCQARLMRILCELFGPDAFLCDVNAPRWLGLSRELLLKDLPRLLSRLQAEGFALRTGSEPLEEACWEFSLDASASSLDWFELHPEILCDGEPLSIVEIQGLLDGSRMLSRGGRMVLLDQASAEVMALLAGDPSL